MIWYTQPAPNWRRKVAEHENSIKELEGSQDRLVEALREVVRVSKFGTDTVSFLIELHRVAKKCAAALAELEKK